MADMTELMQYKMLEDDNKGGGWGAGAFLWVILIFLFFLAFSGNGLFGRRGCRRHSQLHLHERS